MFTHMAVAALLLLVHDPADPNAGWYRDLKVPNSSYGGFCCGPSDCRPVEIRSVGGHWEVFISSDNFPDNATDPNQGHAPNDWVVVPPAVVIPHILNPIGQTVACWYQHALRCVVEGPQT